jgi:hypothetical protein
MISSHHRWRFTLLSIFLLALSTFGQESEKPIVEPIVTASDATPVAITTEFPQSENESSVPPDVEKPANIPEDILPVNPAPFSPFPNVETTTAPPKN